MAHRTFRRMFQGPADTGVGSELDAVRRQRDAVGAEGERGIYVLTPFFPVRGEGERRGRYRKSPGEGTSLAAFRSTRALGRSPSARSEIFLKEKTR